MSVRKCTMMSVYSTLSLYRTQCTIQTGVSSLSPRPVISPSHIAQPVSRTQDNLRVSPLDTAQWERRGTQWNKNIFPGTCYSRTLTLTEYLSSCCPLLLSTTVVLGHVDCQEVEGPYCRRQSME